MLEIPPCASAIGSHRDGRPASLSRGIVVGGSRDARPASPLAVRRRDPRIHAALENAVASIASNTTMMIAPGTYPISSTLYINGSFTNVAVHGATGNRKDVVIVGKGMKRGRSDGGVPFGIRVGGNVRGVTIADPSPSATSTTIRLF